MVEIIAIKSPTKWLTFYKRHFQIHFLVSVLFCILIQMSLKYKKLMIHHQFRLWPSTIQNKIQIQNSNSKFKFKKVYWNTHIQQRYIRSLYNSKHSLEIVPAGTQRDNSATITSKRRCDVVPTHNDAAITPRVRREWHVIYRDISNSTCITCVSMRVIRSPEAKMALNYYVRSKPDSNVCRANVAPTSVQLTSLFEDRILYWLCDVALVVKATTSASKTS